MSIENYMSEEFAGETTSYEEQLLLNYDDFLEGGYTNGRVYLEVGELDDDLEEDFESEYDENDWEEEEDINERLDAEYDKNEGKPGTFLMVS